jgi:antitoxin VapB
MPEDAMTIPPREARLFRNNRSQAVRIPADWELPGDRVTIRRDGDRLILEPQRRPGLLGLLASWEPLDEALPDPADPAPVPEDAL